MHNFIRLGVLMVLTMLICGCNGIGASKVNIETVTYQTDNVSVYVERPSFTMPGAKDFSDSVNKEYADRIDGELVAFDTDSQDAKDLVSGNKCVYEMHTDIKYNKNNFISVLNDSYIYLGGAHGVSNWSAKNIDTVKKSYIKLSDIFEGDYEKVLNRLLEKEIDENIEEYGDLWEKPIVKDSNMEDFYINEDGLVLFYQPYDLSYYARGMVEFTLDFEDICGYMSEEYRNVLVPKELLK